MEYARLVIRSFMQDCMAISYNWNYASNLKGLD